LILVEAAALSPPSNYIGTLLFLAGSFIGVAGWFSSAYRRSVAEARKNDIEALDHRVKTLEDEKLVDRAKIAAQDQTIEVLLDKVRGSDQLAALIAQVTILVQHSDQQHADLMQAVERIARCP
jgi:hypothetical protein